MDGDGFDVCADCNDLVGAEAFLFLGNSEVCADGADQECSSAHDLPDVDLEGDCDGEVDEGFIRDGDQDGIARADCGGQDCEGRDPASNPLQPEGCSDGADNDFDQRTDAEDDECEVEGCSCSNSIGAASPTTGLLLVPLLVARLRSRKAR